MNLGHWLLMLSISSVALVSCSPKYKEGTLLPIRENGTTLRWDGSSRLDKANYYIDGVKVGVGLPGVDAVLKHLSRLETASAVRIESPMEWRTMGYL